MSGFSILTEAAVIEKLGNDRWNWDNFVQNVKKVERYAAYW